MNETAPESRGVRATGPVRAAVAGAGLMGRWHADAIVRAGGVVAAVVDPDRARAERLAARYPPAAVFATVDALLATGGVETVHVCTPPDTHATIGQRVLEAGLHALIEKPLAPTAAATAALLEVAARHGVICCPVHQFLFQPGVRRAQAALPSIGPLRHVDAVACSVGADGHPEARDDVAASIAVHALSLFARLVPGPLAAVAWQVLRSAPGEWRAAGNAGGVSLALLVSLGGRPTANTLRLIGERGTVHVDLFHGFAVVESPGVSRWRKIAHPFTLSVLTLAHAAHNLVRRALRNEPAYPGLRELVVGFHAAIRGAAPGPIEAREILDVATARDALMGGTPCA